MWPAQAGITYSADSVDSIWTTNTKLSMKWNKVQGWGFQLGAGTVHGMRLKEDTLIFVSELAYLKPNKGQNKHIILILMRLSPGMTEFPFWLINWYFMCLWKGNKEYQVTTPGFMLPCFLFCKQPYQFQQKIWSDTLYFLSKKGCNLI